MAHFAKVESGKVVNCIHVQDSDCGGGEFPSSESVGQAFIASLGFDGEWLQTSYTNGFRGQFAGVGMNWNGSVFYPDQPYSSWVLQADGSWASPVEAPTDGGNYVWNDETGEWVTPPS